MSQNRPQNARSVDSDAVAPQKDQRSKYSKYGVLLGAEGRLKRTVNGITFDSQAEAKHYQQLVWLVMAGEITNLVRQQTYKLVVNGQLITSYRSDFEFDDREGRHHVVDVKGVKTPSYIIKARLMKALHGITIEEV